MNSYINSETPGNLNFRQQNVGRGIRRLFWLGVVGFIAITVPAIGSERLTTQWVGIAIALLTIFPSYLWATGRVGGVPIFPAVILACLPTYAMPMINLHKSVLKYDEEQAGLAGLTMCGFLILSTFCWYLTVRPSSASLQKKTVFALGDRAGNVYLILMLFVSVVVEMLLISGWLDIDFGLYAFLRSAAGSLSVLSVMSLSYGVGARIIDVKMKFLFFILLAALMIVMTAGLYLSHAIVLTMSGAVAYVTASRRLPMTWIVTVIVFSFILHPGKDAMRSHYWVKQIPVPPQDYPDFYARWFEESYAKIINKRGEDNSIASSSERAGIIHMLMLVQKTSPEKKPFLLGDTLVHIPKLLVPRFLMSDKPEVHLGQKMMCVYYGLQTPKQTTKTSITFGPIAESYANFGYLGVGCWAIILGSSCGWLTRVCNLADRLTARVLFAFVVTGILINGERNFAIICSTLFQAGIVLSVVCALIMKSEKINPVNSLFDNSEQAH